MSLGVCLCFCLVFVFFVLGGAREAAGATAVEGKRPGLQDRGECCAVLCCGVF